MSLKQGSEVGVEGGGSRSQEARQVMVRNGTGWLVRRAAFSWGPWGIMFQEFPSDPRGGWRPQRITDESEGKPTWHKAWLGHIRNCSFIYFQAQYFIINATTATLDSVKDPPFYSKTASDWDAPLDQYSCWAKHCVKARNCTAEHETTNANKWMRYTLILL